MGQYPNLFSTGVIFEGKNPRIYKSNDRSHIHVVVNRQFFRQTIGESDEEITTGQIIDALGRIIETARQNRLPLREFPPGMLTCASNATQQKVFRKIQKMEINQRSLAMLRHSFLTLCLDLDSYPQTYAEAARLAHSGNYGNRWYHSALQIVVFGNAKACIIFNYTCF